MPALCTKVHMLAAWLTSVLLVTLANAQNLAKDDSGGLILGVHAHSASWWTTSGGPSMGGQVPYVMVPPTQQMDLIRQLGPGREMWMRVELAFPHSWTFNSSAVSRDLGLAATFFKHASQNSIKILPLLLPGSLHPGGGVFTFSSNLNDVEKVAEQVTHAVASTLGPLGASVFGIGGEWNSLCLKPGGGPGGGSAIGDYNETCAAFYVALLRGMNRGVHRASVGYRTQVTTSGWVNYGWNDQLVKHGFTDFDIIAYDWYSDMGDLDNTSSCIPAAGCSRPGPGMNPLEKLLTYNQSIWIGEMNRKSGSVLCDGPSPGCRTTTALTQQAQYLLELIKQLAQKHPQLEAVFVYELLDQPMIDGAACGKLKGSLCGEGHYGLVEVKRSGAGWLVGQKKPAWDAVHQFAQNELAV